MPEAQTDGTRLVEIYGEDVEAVLISDLIDHVLAHLMTGKITQKSLAYETGTLQQ